MSIKNSEQILIVDDDPLSRKILVRALLQAGYICRESSNGVDALRVMHTDPPSPKC
jgi:CheY-like chemotaxis protein